MPDPGYFVFLVADGAMAGSIYALVALAFVVNRVVLRPLMGSSLLSLIMLTLGVGIFMRGAATLVFAGLPGRIASPFPAEPLVVGGVPLSIDKIVAAAFATVCITALSWFFHGSRTGLALRAVASDQQVALAVGIDLHRHFAITWALVGVLSVLAGTLWSFASGGGFGIEL